MINKKLSAYDVLTQISGEDLIIALKSLGEGKYQNANVKLGGIAEALSKLNDKALAKTDLSNLTETGKAAIKEAAPSIPAGSIICFAGIHDNEFSSGGYLYCNGGEVSRSEFAKLFEAIGTTYGAGDGVNTFKIPDFRGCFLRGVGGNSNAVGQIQHDAIRNIAGSTPYVHPGGTGVFSETDTGCYRIGNENSYLYKKEREWNMHCPTASFDASRVVPVANENRPINYAVHYYIKY